MARPRKSAEEIVDGNDGSRTRRQALREAAVDLISRRGYRGTTLRDIASELGVTEPALYYYFSSKEALLFSIYLETLTLALETVRAIRHGPGSPEEKLRKVIDAFTRLVVANRMFIIFFREKGELSPENWQRITQGEREFVGTIGDIVAEGVQAGVFKDLPNRAVAFGILGMAAWVPRWYRPEGPLTLDQVVDVFSELIIGGIRAA
jgi:AcrR family transcriptional regulator